MAEKSYFYDSTTDDKRIYQAADFARFHAQIIGNGVSNTSSLPDLEVTARDNMSVALGAGYMFANGYMYENDSTMTIKHDIADSTNDRIDRVVIQFNNDPTERKIFSYIKKGTPSSNPVPPSVERTEYIHEMSVAQIRIISGKSYIEQPEITDERANDSVCGYIPLHNIYRGLNINEYGSIEMPNQSYVEIRKDNTGYVWEDGKKTIPLINPITDKQSEIKENAFQPKQSGVYMIWIQLRVSESEIQTKNLEGADMQVKFNVDGVENDRPILAHVISTYRDNIFTGNLVTPINAGEKIELYTQHFGAGKNTFNIENMWVRITKLS